MPDITTTMTTRPLHICLTAVPPSNRQDDVRGRVILNANNIVEVTEGDPHSPEYNDRFCLVGIERGGAAAYLGVAESFDEILELLGRTRTETSISGPIVVERV